MEQFESFQAYEANQSFRLINKQRGILTLQSFIHILGKSFQENVIYFHPPAFQLFEVLLFLRNQNTLSEGRVESKLFPESSK